jgi:hypothetical protein
MPRSIADFKSRRFLEKKQKRRDARVGRKRLNKQVPRDSGKKNSPPLGYLGNTLNHELPAVAGGFSQATEGQ